MNTILCLILLIVPLTMAYPRHSSNELDRFLRLYLKERAEHLDEMDNSNSDEQTVDRRDTLLSALANEEKRQAPPVCLPAVWTCGPGLPECCPGLMCFAGNAKRGHHCVARG